MHSQAKWRRLPGFTRFNLTGIARATRDQQSLRYHFKYFRTPFVFRNIFAGGYYLHVYLSAVYLLSDGLDDPDHNVLKPLSLRVVVQNESFAFFCVGAPEGRCSHPWVDGSKVVMQGIEVLEWRGENGD